MKRKTYHILYLKLTNNRVKVYIRKLILSKAQTTHNRNKKRHPIQHTHTHTITFIFFPHVTKRYALCTQNHANVLRSAPEPLL